MPDDRLQRTRDAYKPYPRWVRFMTADVPLPKLPNLNTSYREYREWIAKNPIATCEGYTWRPPDDRP